MEIPWDAVKLNNPRVFLKSLEIFALSQVYLKTLVSLHMSQGRLKL